MSVLYPKTAVSRLNFDYHLTTHIPLVKNKFERFGLKDVRLLRGAAALDGSPAMFEVIAELAFPSIQHLRDALGAHGDEIVGDIPRFTDVQPVIQINEEM